MVSRRSGYVTMPGKTRQERTPAVINPLNAELNPICHLLALLGAHHILHVSGVRVKNLSSEYNKYPVVTPIMWENGGVELLSDLKSLIQFKIKNAKCM